MKLLFENWRKYISEELLVEVSYEKAQESLESKKTHAIVKRYMNDQSMPHKFPAGTDPTDSITFQTLHDKFKKNLMYAVPNDISNNDKGLALLWLLGLARRDPRTATHYFDWSPMGFRIKQDLETFFTYLHVPANAFKEKQLMNYKSFLELNNAVEDAEPAIAIYQSEQLYLDAEEGTDTYRDDDEWHIAVIKNKGAACELGKDTKWCTAAPGGDAFSNYYKPDDPLFYFKNKKTGEKFQFHYGSDQFMDADQAEHQNIPTEEMEKLHNLLKQTDAYKRYKKTIDNYDIQKDLDMFRALFDPESYPGWYSAGWFASKGATDPLETVERVLDSFSPETRQAALIFVSAPYARGQPWMQHSSHERVFEWLVSGKFSGNKEVGLNTVQKVAHDADRHAHMGAYAPEKQVIKWLLKIAKNHAYQVVQFEAMRAIYWKIGRAKMKKTKFEGKTLWDAYTEIGGYIDGDAPK